MSTPQRLAETDAKMIQELNTLGYFVFPPFLATPS